METDRFLREKEVLNIIGFKRSSFREMVRTDKFPKPYKLGLRTVGWSEKEVYGWVEKLKGEQGGTR